MATLSTNSPLLTAPKSAVVLLRRLIGTLRSEPKAPTEALAAETRRIEARAAVDRLLR